MKKREGRQGHNEKDQADSVWVWILIRWLGCYKVIVVVRLLDEFNNIVHI